MKYHNPLRQILSKTRPHWDRYETRLSVRWAFSKALQCRTPELGAEVYGSEKEERIFYHTCKSRPCSSCGYRATVQWQRERWVALPDVPYKGITFTMPDVLWPLFRDNPGLTKALPALAAKIIQSQVNARYGVQVGVMAVPHTFNGQLKFNSHVHTMVTEGGLDGASDTWVSRVYYDRNLLMEAWRRAVIALLRTAHQAGELFTHVAVGQMEAMLAQQEKRWWSIKVQSFRSKEHFLQYAGRYVRRPPIAQHRITHIGKRTVTFWFNDKKLRSKAFVRCSLEEFVDRWAQHIPERYQHAVRVFGLFAPRTLSHTSAGIFAILGQKRRPRPRPRRWADSLKRDFRHDPILDATGNRMKWVRRLAPKAPR